MPNVDEFKKVSMEYYNAMHALARDVLTVIAQTLDLEPTYFKDFTKDAVATLRLLHYPPQAPDSDEKISRGIGAHTDFGSVTLLMQDDCIQGHAGAHQGKLKSLFLGQVSIRHCELCCKLMRVFSFQS